MNDPKINLNRVSYLIDRELDIGEVEVQHRATQDYKTFMLFLNNFEIELTSISSLAPATQKKAQKEKPMIYQFMLILPKLIIENKTATVREAVTQQIQQSFIYPFVILTAILMFVTSIFLSKISKQITQPIIELYEKIKLIIDAHQKEKIELIKQQQSAQDKDDKKKDRSGKEFNIMLNYKPRNNEINVLYLAFSNLTKTIKVARNSLYVGDDNQALLNYHEVAKIFTQMQNMNKLGSCMNNLGCIYLKKNQFQNSFEFVNEAVSIQEDILKKERNKETNVYDEVKGLLFVFACRHYNRALTRQRYILHVIEEYTRNHHLFRAEQ